MKNKTALLLLGVAIIIIGAIVFVFTDLPLSEEGETSPEPEQESPVNIETINFDFPQTLDRTYVSTVDWPPKVRVEYTAYNCTEAGKETARAGETKEQVINGHTYCVTVVSEGAAGSVYHMYTYNFVYGNQNVFVTFSLRFPQCGNYPEDKQSSCKEEQDSFEPGFLVDRVLMEKLKNN